MADLTDDDILETVASLAAELALTEDDRDVILLALQRLVWPPSPWYFLHDRPHMELEIGQREKGGWTGELRCPQGCGRSWRVETASSETAVYDALTAAHGEYRTGRSASVAVPVPGKVNMRDLLDGARGQRAEYVEVQDRRFP